MSPHYEPDYKNPYDLLGRCYRVLKYPPPPNIDTSEKTLKKCLALAQEIYFPDACPKCHHPYPKNKNKKGLYLSANPDQIHCFNCMVKILEKAFVSVLIEKKVSKNTSENNDNN